MGDVLASGGFEGRGRLRKARGNCQTSVDPEIPELACTESIGACGKRGELNISVTAGVERKIAFLSSGERTGKSPHRGGFPSRGCRASHMRVTKSPASGIFWKVEP